MANGHEIKMQNYALCWISVQQLHGKPQDSFGEFDKKKSS